MAKKTMEEKQTADSPNMAKGKKVTEKGKPVDFQKDGYYYLIGFHYKHGSQTGFGSFEQATAEQITNVTTLRNIMMAYQQAAQQNVLTIRKSIPWWKFWEKLAIPTEELICNALTFQLLRTGKILVKAQPTELNAIEKAKISELNEMKAQQESELVN